MAEKEIDKRASVEIKLDFPIEIDGREISSVTMRRPKVRDSMKADKVKGGAFEKGLTLLSDLCDMAPEELEELDELDLEKLQAQYAAFTGRAATAES